MQAKIHALSNYRNLNGRVLPVVEIFISPFSKKKKRITDRRFRSRKVAGRRRLRRRAGSGNRRIPGPQYGTPATPGRRGRRRQD